MPLAGKPLFIRQAERVAASALSGTIVVATTLDPKDDRVQETCEQEGWKCFRGHAEDLLDRHYQAALLAGADIVIKIPSDCPLIDPAIIDQVVAAWMEDPEKYDYLSNLHPGSFPDGNDVEIMSFHALEQAWRHATLPLEREHTTPYIWERPEQFRIGNVVMEGGVDYSMTHRWTIDYKEDYAFIRAVFEELYPIDPFFGVGEILSLLERRPDLYEINRQWAGVNWYRKHLGELKTVTVHQTKLLETER